jgi:hypothetical protein
VCSILRNKPSTLKWALKDIALDKLVNPKTDLRYVRSQVFRERIHSSLLTLGIIEPLKVRMQDSDTYEILDGVTRKQDLNDLGYVTVPCLVTSCTDVQALTFQCAFSFTRRNLDPIGMALYVKLMHDKGLTLTKIGEPFNMKKAQVSKYLALNKLSDIDKLKVANRELTIDQGYAIVKRTRPSFDFKPKPIPCPFCGTIDEAYPTYRTLICSSCEETLKQVLAKKRKHKQKKLDKVFPNKLSRLR